MDNQVSQVELIPRRKTERKALLKRFPGLLSAVSRRHRVDSGQVNRVFHGFSTSARIKNGLEAEIRRRIEAEQQGQVPISRE